MRGINEGGKLPDGSDRARCAGGTAWTGERQELRENSGKPAHRYACRRPEMGGSGLMQELNDSQQQCCSRRRLPDPEAEHALGEPGLELRELRTDGRRESGESDLHLRT